MAIDQDLELMLLVRKGDTESFEVLLRRYRTPLVNFFVRMVWDQALAEDLAQEVFLRVYQARHRHQPEARFTTWLYRIATNLRRPAQGQSASQAVAKSPTARAPGPASAPARGFQTFARIAARGAGARDG